MATPRSAPRRRAGDHRQNPPNNRRGTSREVSNRLAATAKAVLVGAAAMSMSATHTRTANPGGSKGRRGVADALNLGGKTVVVGLNAALQKRFVLPPSGTLVPGSVHRAERIEEGVGGKGQDVAVALSCLWGREGSGENVALAQFIGSGAEGDAVMGMLEGILGPRGGGGGDGSKWDSLTVRPEAGLRTCTTIVGSDCATELVEPSGAISGAEMDDLLNRVEPPPGANRASGLCVMGSMPPGCPGQTYAEIYDHVADEGTACLVDSVAGLEPLLGAMAAKRASFPGGEDATAAAAAVLKLNAAELCRLADVEKGSGGGEAERATDDDIDAAVRGFLAQFRDAAGALDYLAITDGRHRARLVELRGKEDHVVHGLDVIDLLEDDEMGGGGKGEIMLYPIGAGDTVAAGTLAAMIHFQRGQSELGKEAQRALSEYKQAQSSKGSEARTAEVAASFAFGLACGSASCLKQENSVLDVDDALRLFSKASTAPK